jgi:hypothetical protein
MLDFLGQLLGRHMESGGIGILSPREFVEAMDRMG